MVGLWEFPASPSFSWHVVLFLQPPEYRCMPPRPSQIVLWMNLFIPACDVMLGLCQFENIGSVNYIPLPNINIYVSLYISTLMYLLIACVYDVCVGICMPQYSCGDQRTTCWSWFSPSITWISGTKLRSSYLAQMSSVMVRDEPSYQLWRISLCSTKHHSCCSLHCAPDRGH